MKPFTYYFLRKATPTERTLYEEAEKAGFPGLTFSISEDPEQQPPDRDGTAYDHEDDELPPRSFGREFTLMLLIGVGVWLVVGGIFYLIWFWPR